MNLPLQILNSSPTAASVRKCPGTTALREALYPSAFKLLIQNSSGGGESNGTLLANSFDDHENKGNPLSSFNRSINFLLDSRMGIESSF